MKSFVNLLMPYSLLIRCEKSSLDKPLRLLVQLPTMLFVAGFLFSGIQTSAQIDQVVVDTLLVHDGSINNSPYSS
jgi:hypothetical protein